MLGITWAGSYAAFLGECCSSESNLTLACGKASLFAERTKLQLLGLGWKLRRAQGLSICLRSRFEV